MGASIARFHRLRTGKAGAIALAAITWSGVTRADFSLSWDAPAQCPDRGDVLTRMTNLPSGRDYDPDGSVHAPN